MNKSKIICSLLFSLCFLVIQVRAENPAKNLHGRSDGYSFEQSKTIQKVYIISRNTPLHIQNQYGKVNVNTWDKMEIKVDITIRAMERSDSKAEDIVNSVSIEEEKNSNSIQLSTHINRNKTNWWNNVISSNNRGVQINYTIYLPKNNDLAIHHKFGAVTLPDLNGETTVDIAYGSLTAGKLLGPKTAIHSSYSSGNIAAVIHATLDYKYGKITLGEAKTVQLDLAYCGNSSIHDLQNSGRVNIRYSGGFHVGLGKDINHFDLDADYSSCNLRIDPAAHFNYDVSVSYGSFNEGNSTITHEDPSPDSRGPRLHRNYQGYHGKTSSNHVSLNSRYGSISFKD